MTPDAKIQIFAVKRGSTRKNFSVKYAVFFSKYNKKILNHHLLKDYLSQPLSNGIFVPPTLFGQGTKLVNVFDLYQGIYIQEDNLDEVQISEHEKEKYLTKEGDVLFCRSSIKPEGVGWTSYIKQTKQVLVYECHIIRAHLTKDILPAFLSHFARTTMCRDYILANANITTMATISQDVIENMPVICPSIKEQQRLVKSLESAYELKRQKFKKAEELLAGMDEFVFNTLQISANNTANNLGFAVYRKEMKGVIDVKRHLNINQIKSQLKVQDVANIINQKINPQYYPVDVFDWIRIDDLPNQPIDILEVRTEQGDAIEGTFFEVRPGDILVARLGPTILNRKTVMVRTIQRRTIASAEFLVLRCKDRYLPEAVMAILKTHFFVNQMYAHARGSTPSRYRLNREDMLNLPFPDISDIQLQQAISQEAVSRRCQAIDLRKTAENDWQEAKEQFEKQLLGE